MIFKEFYYKIAWGLCLVFVILLGSNNCQAGELATRMAAFPHWQGKPTVTIASGDLVYPDWMAGTWNVSSILVDMAAPLAPDIVTPGFEGNRRYLHQPVLFQVRFQPMGILQHSRDAKRAYQPFFQGRNITTSPIIADREFNGFNIAKATLGEAAVLGVKVDPNNPNLQMTLLPGNRQLKSLVTRRGSEMPHPDEFVATEITQQIFQDKSQIYLNEVETTTAYHWVKAAAESDTLHAGIEADQVTAIYLSPKDPNFFVAEGRPVALYRYRLLLSPSS